MNSTSKLKGGYYAIHKWLQSHYGKASRCEGKDCNGVSKMYHYALKHGKEYAYKRGNFLELCSSCHKIYDITEESIKKMAETQRRKVKDGTFGAFKNGKAVDQFDAQGNFVKRFDSQSKAGRETLINQTDISNAINGRRGRKTAGGYIWRFAVTAQESKRKQFMGE